VTKLAILVRLMMVVVVGAAPTTAFCQSPEGATGPLLGDLFSDKALVVDGWSSEELEKILADFASKYKENVGTFRHVIFAKGATKRVSLPDDLAPDLLSYLVNYVHYPDNLELEGRNPVAIGIATVTRDFGAPPSEIGKKAYFYVPSKDKDFDVVYIKVGPHVYEQSFTSMEWKPMKDPRLSDSARTLMKRNLTS
jgi:hypothetical protein